MDICNRPRPLGDIVIFLKSALERHFAEGGERLDYFAFLFVHTIFTHSGFCLPINGGPPEYFRYGIPPSFPRTIRYTLCTAPRDHRASVTLYMVDGCLTVKGCWLAPGSLDDGDGSLLYEARSDYLELERQLRLVLWPVMLERLLVGVNYRENYRGLKLGVLMRFWRKVEAKVCNPLRRQW